MSKKKVEQYLVRIKNCRLSYAYIWEPATFKNQDKDKERYSASLIISKNDKATIAQIKKAVEQAKDEGKLKLWGGVIPNPANFGEPLHDGDIEKAMKDAAYENAFFINAKNKRKPGVFDQHCRPITDETKVYSGCYCNVDVAFYPYDNTGCGVSASLVQIQLVREGEPLGGISAPAFEEVPDEEAPLEELPDFMQ